MAQELMTQASACMCPLQQPCMHSTLTQTTNVMAEGACLSR